MELSRSARVVLFAAALLAGVAAGNLFYDDRLTAGGACLCMSGMFLGFASHREKRDAAESADAMELRDINMAEAAIFMGELALMSLRNIGRTIPPSTKEIEQTEDKVTTLMEHLGVSSVGKNEIKDEFDKLKGRSRRSEGGRALVRSSRL